MSLSKLLNSSRTKRRRIRNNVQKAISNIVSDANAAMIVDSSNLAASMDPETVDDSGVLHGSYCQLDDDTEMPMSCILGNDCRDNCLPIDSGDECSVKYISSDSLTSDGEFDTPIDAVDDENLGSELADWASQCNIPQSHVGQLLNVLQKYHPTLPKDPRTLLKTVRTLNVRELSGGGQYFHFGIKPQLQQMWVHNQLKLPVDTNRLLLQINVDGLQLFKSSGYQFWPILGMIVDSDQKHVFEIGLFGGYHRPLVVGEFLSDFVTEMKNLESEALLLGDVTYWVVLHSVVCDAPARSYLKCIRPHNSYHGCERCTEAGDWVKNRVTFPSVDKPVRTDAEQTGVTPNTTTPSHSRISVTTGHVTGIFMLRCIIVT